MNRSDTVTVGSLCSQITSGGTPSRSNPEYWSHGTIPWMKTGEISQGFVHDTEEKINVRGLENSAAKLIPKNSVIVALYGDGYTAGSVAINKLELTTNQACCNLIVDPEKCHYAFLYYYLKGSYNNLVSLKSGGSQQNLNAQSVRSFPVQKFELSSQKRIAAILSAYDELIETNQRRIALLEKLAEEFYREWFVRLRFPGHEKVKKIKGVPEGWEIWKLPDIADITYGFPFDGSRFNAEGVGKPIIRIRNIPDSTTRDFTDEEAADKYLVQPGDLLVGMDGEFHINRWHGPQAYLVQRVCRLRAKSPLLEGYLGHAIRGPVKHYESILMGATVGHLGAMHLKAIECLVPPKSMLARLGIFNELNQQIGTLECSNRHLTRTRDLLLPRLISGKLSVEELDIQFPPEMAEEGRDLSPKGPANVR